MTWPLDSPYLIVLHYTTSPLPTDAILKMSLHFLHLWSIGQKGFLSDFEKMVY